MTASTDATERPGGTRVAFTEAWSSDRGNVGWGQAFTKLNVGDPVGAEFDDVMAGIDHDTYLRPELANTETAV